MTIQRTVLTFPINTAGTVWFIPEPMTMILAGWFASMNERDKAFAREYIGSRYTPKEEMHWEFIRLALARYGRRL